MSMRQLLSMLFALAACGTDPPAPAGASMAVYDVAAVRDQMLAVPFPSELHRDASGAVQLGAIPGAPDGAAFDVLRASMARRGGHCTTCGAFFAIEGGIDVASLPSGDGVDATPTLDDPVLLVDIDETSPEMGRLIPLRHHYFEAHGIVAVRPAPGVVLARNRRYAAVLTSALLGDDGLSVRASPDFVALRDGRAGADAVEAARPIVAPAIDTLATLGALRASIIALTPFTTGDATTELMEVRELVREGVAPTAVVDQIYRAPDLDALLGTPVDDGPGIDHAPAPSTEGTRAISHATTSLVVTGTFDAARLVSGSGTDVGVPLRDAEGHLTSEMREDVPFSLIVPAGADISRLPVVLSLHGFNASRIIGFALADTAGAEGVAVLSIDYFQHGERAVSAVDEMHAMRGEFAGPDGFAETNPLDVSARVFGVTGVAPGTELAADYPHASLLQFAADAMSALRFIREGDLDALRGVPELTVLAFDASRIYVVGNSLGAEVSAMVLAVEDPVAGAVLDVPPGSVVDNLVDSPEFRPLTDSLFLPLLGLRGPFTEPERGLAFDPIIDLYRAALEPVDPLALAPHLIRDRVAPGDAPPIVMQIAAFDEVAAVGASEAMISATGAITDFPLTLARDDGATAPSARGHRLAGGHGMMEVLRQESRYEPPAVPPFRRRDPAIVIDNPIVEVHAQIAAVLRE